MEEKDKTGGNHQSEKSFDGVIKLRGQSKLPEEFIKGGKDVKDTLPRTVFRNEKQLYDTILYLAQLEMFNDDGNMNDEINDVINLLNGAVSVGGISRALMAQTAIGIFYPETSGVNMKLNKETQKAIIEAQRFRSRAYQGNNGGEENKEEYVK